MIYDHRRPDVAVFIDFENVYVSVRDKLDANPNFETIMERCNDLGRVVIARAYADWYRYPRITSALYANSIEPMYVPTYYYDKDMGRTGRAIKNSVDMNLCIDTMKTLFTNTNIGKFVLVTGDRDFIPLVNSIRQHGKEVIVIGIGGAASAHLAQCADEFIFYEQLVGKVTPPAKRKGSGTTGRAEVTDTDTVVAKEEQPQETDIYDVLVEAVHLVRERGYVSTLGSLKLVMKELMGGDFKENRYKDVNGRPFTKFKEFVLDAERRGRVQIFTSGTVNEVFLPGEDPLKLSQFAGDLKEEPIEPSFEELSVLTNGYQGGQQELPVSPAETTPPNPAAGGRSRRRRRPRNHRQNESRPEKEMPVSFEPELTDHLAAPDEAVSEQAQTEAAALFDTVLSDVLSSHKDRQRDDLLADLFAKSQSEQHDDTLFDRILAGELLIAPDEEATGEASSGEASAEELAGQVSMALLPEVTDAIPVIDETPAQETVFVNEEEARTLGSIAPAEAEPEADQQVGEPAYAAEVPQEQPAAEVASEDETDETEAAESQSGEQIVFHDDEWQVFRTMMKQFSKPVSFSQIVDSLKELRNKQQKIDRRNEQLRTMVKQAIQMGLLERVGRGSRIYYKIAHHDSN